MTTFSSVTVALPHVLLLLLFGVLTFLFCTALHRRHCGRRPPELDQERLFGRHPHHDRGRLPSPVVADRQGDGRAADCGVLAGAAQEELDRLEAAERVFQYAATSLHTGYCCYSVIAWGSGRDALSSVVPCPCFVLVF